MLQTTDSVNASDHQATIERWKLLTADALNGQEEERRKRLEAEAAMATMVSDLLGSGDRAVAIGAVIRAARDVVALNTEVAHRQLEAAIRDFDQFRERERKAKNGGQAS
jgi:hypothetical protein